MKTIISLTCPNCTAQLSLEKDREVMFCQYCGTKLLLNDENTYTHRHIDEAEIKRVEAEKLIRLKELELEEKEFDKKQVHQKKTTKLCFGIGGILFLLGIIGYSIDNFILSMCFIYGVAIFMFGFTASLDTPSKQRRKRHYYGKDAIKITSTICHCKNKPFQSVETLIKQAGFSNVECVPLKDLNILHIKQNGLTKEVIIDGENDFEEGDTFSSFSKVVIMYHSIKNSLF